MSYDFFNLHMQTLCTCVVLLGWW